MYAHFDKKEDDFDDWVDVTDEFYYSKTHFCPITS
jgi:hypothetical protein